MFAAAWRDQLSDPIHFNLPSFYATYENRAIVQFRFRKDTNIIWQTLTQSSDGSLSGFHSKSKFSHSSLEILLQWALNHRLRPTSTTAPRDCGGCGFDLFNKTALSAHRSRNRPFQSSASFAWSVARQLGDKQRPQTESLIKQGHSANETVHIEDEFSSNLQ